jgi:deoxyribonuclease-4
MVLGAHVSISGSLDLAVDRACALGCECLQIFYGSPRQWRIVTYPEDAITQFIEKRARARLDPLMAHAAYLVNLAAPARADRRRAVASLCATVAGVARLGGLGAVTHLGSRVGAARGTTLRRVAASLREVLDATAGAMVLLENSAGAGGTLGASFDDLAAVLAHLDGHPRVGVCLDSAHLFAAGWDLRTPEGVGAMVEAAGRAFEWGRVRLFHLNDSQGPLNSHLDRHANIGEGWIGIGGFRAIVNHRAIRPLPGIIETPGFDGRGPDRQNLGRLRRLRARGALAARKGPGA